MLLFFVDSNTPVISVEAKIAIASLLLIAAFSFYFLRREIFAKRTRLPEQAPSASPTSASDSSVAEPISRQEPAPKPAPEPAPAPATAKKPQWQSALKKSREPLLQKLRNALSVLGGGSPWNDDHPLWEALEEALITSDVAPRMTVELLEKLRSQFNQEPDEHSLKSSLQKLMIETLEQIPAPNLASGDEKPNIIVLIGINGSGKTTTTGKLAYLAKKEGKSVIVGAGDTFRAAAVEQLKGWAARLEVDCIEPAKGANPAAVAFDTVQAGLSRNVDTILIDTAGRLHTKDALMEELKKVGRVIEKKASKHKVLLVLDATLGQNAIVQAREFTNAMPVTGVVLTKLDGSAKGGAAFSVVAELGIPIVYVGLGESAEDLRTFSAKEFVENLLPSAEAL